MTNLLGPTLVRASHPQLSGLHASPGDRVYLCAFADGKLALIGRLTLNDHDAQRDTMVGEAPFTACRVDRIVPHEIARKLRSTVGAQVAVRAGVRLRAPSRSVC